MADLIILITISDLADSCIDMHLRDHTLGIARRAVLFSVVMLGVAACSASSASESGTADIATLDDVITSTASSNLPSPVPSTTTQAEVLEEMTVEDAQLAFASCMRETYPSWPDPQPDGGFGGRAALAELGIDPQDGEFFDLLQECRTALQGAVGLDSLSPAEQVEQEDTVLALFACVRDQPGFEDVPDPDFGTGPGLGFGMRELFQSGAVDPQAFASAIQQCAAEQGLEGGPGRGGRGGLLGGRPGGNNG